MKSLDELIKKLPPEYEQEVQDFIEFLLEKKKKKQKGKPTFEWAGALRDLRNQYTSVELQHKISELRSEKL
ncbi:MAG: DUF2281 domain-containing protein [Candidatus Jettenia sp.]|nr:MAG: DUF2281 domain-containing protein [Candidatus Jettenia sp.]